MAHKTFISYKFSESEKLRNKIIEALGDDAKYYYGETSESPNMDDLKTETIREKLKLMIRGTSVIILIISPNMANSNWIDWEIGYALKELSNNGNSSKTNGIVGVILNCPDSSWFKHSNSRSDGHVSYSFSEEILPEIVRNNRYNQVPKEYFCDDCKSVDSLYGSYISFVTEDDFFKDPNRYIENAYYKSQHIENYDIKKIMSNDKFGAI